MEETDGEWPPPGDSSLVTALLTVSEGLLVGSVGTLLLIIILALASLQADSPMVTDAPVETAGITGLLLVLVALIARRVWSGIEARRAEQEGSNGVPDDSYAEWRRTWPPLSVLLIAAFIGVAFLTLVVVQIGWIPIGWVVRGALVLYGILVVGFALRVFVHYKIRGTIR